MVKVFCPRPGCGASFHFADGTQKEDTDRVVNAHVESEHGTVESKHRDFIEAARDAFALIAAGGRITKLHAKDLHSAASDLISKPRLAITDVTEPQPGPEETENKNDAGKNDSAPGNAAQSGVPETLSGT